MGRTDGATAATLRASARHVGLGTISQPTMSVSQGRLNSDIEAEFNRAPSSAGQVPVAQAGFAIDGMASNRC